MISLVICLYGNLFAQKTDPPKAPVAAPAPAPTPAAVKMPTVAEILAKYVQAIGGRAANEKIKSRVSKGTIEIPAAGISGTVENYSTAPGKSFSTGNIPGIGVLMDGFDGTTGWVVNPLQGNRDKAGPELQQLKLTSDFYREINLDKVYSKLELKGTDKVGDAEVYVVVATSGDLPAETFYFDTRSGLLLRSDSTVISPEGNTATKTFFEDYRDLDGVKIPFRTRAILPQFELITTLTDVKNNVPIDDAKFAKPK